jgi:arylsulfatase A-like enzyme
MIGRVQIWVLASTLLLLACSRPPEVAFDLLKLPATSRVAFGQVQLGTAAGQQYLRDGWPFPRPGQIPDSPGLSATEPLAEVRFVLLLPTDLSLEARYSYQGVDPVTVEIACNKQSAGRAQLDQGEGGVIRVSLAEQALKPGLNHFSVSLPASAVPLTTWHSFTLKPASGLARAEGEVLVVPPNSRTDFYFQAPQSAGFQAQAHFVEAGDRLEIEFAAAQSNDIERLTIDSDGLHRFAFRPLPAGTPCRLTLLGGKAEVRLGAPAVTGVPDQDQVPTPETFTTPSAPRPPLVVLLCIDTLRADVLGSYGAKPSSTPRLDAAFTAFRRVSAQSSWTKSTVASVFTGRTVLEHGVRGFRDKLPDQEATLAESLRSLGYRTVGLTANRWTGEEFGFAQGFDHYASVRPLAQTGVDHAIEQLDKQRSGEPMFLFLHLLDPHDPYAPPASFRPADVLLPDASEKRILSVESQLTNGLPVDPRQMSDIQAYYKGEVRYTDHEVGRLLDHLKSTDRYDSALIMAFSDHGEAFGEHLKMRHGSALFEELLWVPWLVKLPSATPSPLTLDSAAQQIDIMPTLLGLLNSPVPSQVEGVNHVTSRPEALEQRVSLAYLEFGTDADLVGLDETPWLRQYESATGYGYKLHVRQTDTFSPRLPLLQLFDLHADPAERKDLSHLAKVEMGFLWAQLEAARRRARNSEQGDPEKTRDAFRSLPYLR